MDLLLLTVAFALLDLLALARLIQVFNWTRIEATVHCEPIGGLWVYTGQPLPISFTTHDGRRIDTSLRRWDKSLNPPHGALLRVLYNPDDPKQVERPIAIAFLGLVVIALTTGFGIMAVQTVQAALSG